MEGPVLLGGGAEAPSRRVPCHLERGHPERGRRAQSQGQGGEGRPGDAETGWPPAGSRPEVSYDEEGGEERGHRGHVGGAGEHLEPGQQPPAEHVPWPSAGEGGLLCGLQHPGQPGGPREVVPHVGQGKERPGQHPEGGRHERPAALGSQEAGQAEEAGARKHEVHEHEGRVGHREGQDQVEPREGVEHLGVGLGQHRLAERHPGVPDRPAAGGHRPHEGLDLGRPVGEDVALEEHAPEGEGEEGDERERGEDQRGASGGSQRSPRRRAHALLHERVPLVAVGAAPQHVVGAVAAGRADVRVHVEGRLLDGGHVALLVGPEGSQDAQGAPDLEVDEQDVRVGLEGPQEQAQGLLGAVPRAQLAREGQPGPPVPRVLAHQALAQGGEARGLAAGGVRLLQRRRRRGRPSPEWRPPRPRGPAPRGAGRAPSTARRGPGGRGRRAGRATAR